MTDGPTPVLAVSGLSVDYGGVRALDDASFTVAPMDKGDLLQ
jgi:ABC-type branched-subunit amino acid transport system ATPase component